MPSHDWQRSQRLAKNEPRSLLAISAAKSKLHLARAFAEPQSVLSLSDILPLIDSSLAPSD